LAAVKRVARETASERYDASGIPVRRQRQLRAQLDRLIETIPWGKAEQHLVDAYLEYAMTPGSALSYIEFLAAGGVE